MTRNKPMRIDIWDGDWGLPSVDLKCLQILTYAKFAGIELELRKTNNPFWTPSGSLPVCYIGNQVLKNLEDLCSYAKSKNVCPDFGLSAKQYAETVAYTNMLKEEMFPAMQYIWWIDTKNHIKFTRPWYYKAIPFPFCYYYPNKYLKEATDMIEVLYENSDNELEIETRIYAAAQKCLTALSIRLGESDYMFGSNPMSLDAIMYGYLAPLLKVPFPNCSLKNHLNACTNLQKFVTRISQRYYLKDIQEYETRKKEEQKKNAENISDADFPNKIRNQVLAGLFAVGAMSMYAFSTGIIQHSMEKVAELPVEPPFYSNPHNNEEK